MILPQMEFTPAEHDRWVQQRTALYETLQTVPATAKQRILLETLRKRHTQLVHAAFVLCQAGAEVVPLSQTENLLLCHTSPATTGTLGIALNYQFTPSDQPWAVYTKSIAVFGEKIGFDADIRNGGRGGYGVNAGPEPFLGVLATHAGPQRAERYIPYDCVELGTLAGLLEAFDPQPRATVAPL
jgi:hypothetical protein